MDALTKQVRQLRRYVALLTVIILACLIAIVFLLWNRNDHRFDQLTAQRTSRTAVPA